MQGQSAVMFAPPKEPKLFANLLGDFQNQAEIKDVKDLLLELGIFAEYLPGGGIKSGILQRAHLNIYHSPISEVFIKKRLQTRFGRPYLTVSFFGPSEIAGSLRDIGLALGLSSSDVEPVIRRGLGSITEGINFYGSELFGKRVLVLLEGYHRDLVKRIVDDLGMQIVPIHHIRNQHVRPDTLTNLLRDNKAQLVIGSDYNLRLSNGMEVGYLILPDPEQSFLGFAGFTNLARCIALALRGGYPVFHE